jgi:acyl carrier protein
MKISEEDLKNLIAEIARKPASTITPETSFRRDLRFDSLASVDLLSALEEDHGIEVPQSVARTLETYGQLLEFLKTQT